MAKATKAATDDRRLATIAKLMAKQRELVDNLLAITIEIDDLLGGGAGIGAKMKQLTVAFESAWAARYGSGLHYVWNGVRDFANMKRLIRTLGVDDLEGRITVFMRSDEQHYVNARHSFPMFVATVNAHTAAPLLADDGGPVVDCRHEPRCQSDVTHTKRQQRELRA